MKKTSFIVLVTSVMMAGVVAGAWAQAAEASEVEAAGDLAAWVQTVANMERIAVYTEEDLDISDESTRGTDCPTVPTASWYAEGSVRSEVIVYGRILRCQGLVCTNRGFGACLFDPSPSGPPCYIGAAKGRTMTNTTPGSPVGVTGDPIGGTSNDRIYPASYCSPSRIPCWTDDFYQYYVTMSGVASDTQWEICGDDCSISSGGSDTVVGWTNRDIIFAGAGADSIWGQEGSDCIFGDDHGDTIHGGDCLSTDPEYLWGLNGNDIVTDNLGTCSRYVLGGLGDDSLKGGPGSDTIYGDAGDDSLYGENGIDYCHGGSHIIRDFCEPNPSCETRVQCESP